MVFSVRKRLTGARIKLYNRIVGALFMRFRLCFAVCDVEFYGVMFRFLRYNYL